MEHGEGRVVCTGGEKAWRWRHGTTMAVAAHPGVSNTELIRNAPAAFRLTATWVAPLLTQTADMGALPAMRAATDPAVLGGQYYGPSGLARSAATPRWSPPAPTPTTTPFSNDCGPSPRNSPASRSPSTRQSDDHRRHEANQFSRLGSDHDASSNCGKMPRQFLKHSFLVRGQVPCLMALARYSADSRVAVCADNVH